LRPWKRVMLKRSFVKDGCMSFIARVYWV
jgi:hypothetical protein